MTMRPLASDPIWLKKAFNDLGIHEIAGPAANRRVLELFRLAGHPEIKSDEVAWCSAAVNGWMAESGIVGTRNLMARSWETWGKPVSRSRIPRGAILVFKRGTGWQGHVCLCLSDDGATVTAIGGNQSDSVSIARYRKRGLVATRWPSNVAVAEAPGVDTPVNLAMAEDVTEAPDEPAIDEAVTPAPTITTSRTMQASAFGGITGVAGLFAMFNDWKVLAVVGVLLMLVAFLVIGKERIRKIIDENM